jgi:hypothetical protein
MEDLQGRLDQGQEWLQMKGEVADQAWLEWVRWVGELNIEFREAEASTKADRLLQAALGCYRWTDERLDDFYARVQGLRRFAEEQHGVTLQSVVWQRVQEAQGKAPAKEEQEDRGSASDSQAAQALDRLATHLEKQDARWEENLKLQREGLEAVSARASEVRQPRTVFTSKHDLDLPQLEETTTT